MLPAIVAVLIIVVVLALVRTVRHALRPSESDRFHTASSLTTAWSRGEEEPPVYPDEPRQPAAQRSSTLRQGLPRSSST